MRRKWISMVAAQAACHRNPVPSLNVGLRLAVLTWRRFMQAVRSISTFCRQSFSHVVGSDLTGRSGRPGRQTMGSAKLPPGARAGRPEWGYRPPLPRSAEVRASRHAHLRSFLVQAISSVVGQSAVPDEVSKDEIETESIRKRIRRIEARKFLFFGLLVAVWVFICAFVIAAMWLDWGL